MPGGVKPISGKASRQIAVREGLNGETDDFYRIRGRSGPQESLAERARQAAIECMGAGALEKGDSEKI